MKERDYTDPILYLLIKEIQHSWDMLMCCADDNINKVKMNVVEIN